MTNEIDSGRYSYLFEVAHGESEVEDGSVSEEERAEVQSIRSLLRFIDTTWQAVPSELDSVRARFLEKLAAQDPDHPWVIQSSVRTVGDLVQASGEDIPGVPQDVYAQLLNDPTPVEGLLDGSRRTQTIGTVVRAVQMPQAAIGEFLLWVNRTVTALFPLAGPAQPRYVFTRRQEKPGGRR